MGDVVIVVVIVVVLVVGAALVARVTGRGRPGGEGGGAGRRMGDGGAPGGTVGAGRRPEGPPAFRRRAEAGTPPGPGPQGGDGEPATGPMGPAEEVVGPTVQRPEAAPAASLPELLAGIEWPCGLERSRAPGHPGDERYQALTTTGAAPDEVGAAIGDELERLGYRLHSLSSDEAVARRGDELLSLRLHPDAAGAQLDGGPLFPDAGPGTVGIELWAGAGPNPRPA